MNLADELKKIIKGEVVTDEKILDEMSRDAGLLVVKPAVVVYPKDVNDLKNLVKFVGENKKSNKELSLTSRSAGTDMSGGPLNESIIVNFTKYFTNFRMKDSNSVIAEPGLYYRIFEKEMLRYGLIFPSYPASKSICAIGGIVNNNSGGEKTLKYGKTENFIEGISMVLSDGNEYNFHALNEEGLKSKMKQKDFEGEIYKNMYKLITKNYKLITEAKPDVTKNSAGYLLWNVYNKEEGIFDLTQIFVGAQGTLGIMKDATIRLVPIKKRARMLVIFLNDVKKLKDLIPIILKTNPESFETYDDNTLKLAMRFFPSFAKILGAKNLVRIAFSFLPEFFMLLRGGLPKLILQVEFSGDDNGELDAKIEELSRELKPFDLNLRAPKTQFGAKKYWTIRRESFNLLRHHIKDKHTAPFIDDFAVKPEKLPQFLPELDLILEQYKLIYTIAGHVGDGNFHIIPLMNLKDEAQRNIIPELSEKVYNLVFKYNGTTTGEHNDGLIRSPYLKQMYGEKVFKLFEETKKIFDPQNIFNPGKKIGSSLEYTLSHIRKD